MANEESHQNWESKFRHLMREEEAPLPFDILLPKNLHLLLKFISTHRDEITLATDKLPELDFGNYTELASLIRILQNHSLLHIIDYISSFVIETIRKLRCYNFGGSWFDSLESIIVDNLQNNIIYLENLNQQERILKSDKDILCHGCFQHQSKELESQIANIMEQVQIISNARNSLNFFYPA